ncbi:MAG: LysR family transcriptional regulator [Nannocystaceae bacterium]|nr:LysR family transcriptional regulator [bacterium]
MELPAVDLNLLVTLDAVLCEGTVTAAARRLGVGQPAVSHALNRLADAFGEPLFVRSGRRVVPTARAEALRGPLRRLLHDARNLLEMDPSADLEQTRRRFRIRCPDLLAPAIPELTRELSHRAPHASLEVSRREGTDVSALESGEADVLLGVERRVEAGLHTRRLGTLKFVVVARTDHPALAKRSPLSQSAWTRYPHIVVKTGSRSRSLVGDALASAGLDRRVGLVLPSFLAALVTAANTDHLFAAPHELVRPLLGPLGLTTRRLPVALEPVSVAAYWHARAQDDAGHRMLRSVVAGVLGEVLG